MNPRNWSFFRRFYTTLIISSIALMVGAAAPIDAAGAQVRQGMLEGSNVNPLVEITQLIEISRAYERATKMIENVTELSRRSVERLGRSS